MIESLLIHLTQRGCIVVTLDALQFGQFPHQRNTLIRIRPVTYQIPQAPYLIHPPDSIQYGL